MRFNQSQRRITRDETEKKESSPTRIRTAVARFRVSSANHYTIGDTILSLPSFSLVPKRIEIWKYHNSVSKPKKCLEIEGIDPSTSRMLSERSTI